MIAAIDHPANTGTRAHRASLPALNDFDLETLQAMPPYWGWVEHQIETTADSFLMLLGGNDDGVVLRLFWNGHYERQTLAIWARLVRQHTLALDIGAHTGAYTLAAHAANPTINILAFEPNALNYARLMLNLRANESSTADAYMLGVSDAERTIPFTMRVHSDYRSTGGTFEPVEGGHVTGLLVATLDSFLPPDIADSVGLIKLDVEGHEHAALSGMRGLITRSRPTLVFECLSDATAHAASDMLGPLGYHFFEIDDAAQTISETKHVAPVFDASGNLVASRLNRVAACSAEDIAIIRAG